MPDGAEHRVWREAAQGAQRAEFHGVAKVLDDGLLAGHVDAVADLVHRLDATDGADPAGRALAAALLGAKLEGEAGLPGHIDAVVEDDDAGVADEAVLGGKGLVIEGRVEKAAGEVGAQRAADLHGLHGPTGGGAAADVVHQLAERDAEGGLEQAAVADVARELDRDRAARPAHAEVAIESCALRQDDRDGG